jgi:hypothetical protein
MRRRARRSLILWVVAIVALCANIPGFAGSHRHLPREDTELSFFLGVLEPRGESGIWRQNSRDLTFAPEDLDDAVFGARIGSLINNFVAFDVGVSYFDGGTRTEYRDFTAGPFGDPIRQKLRLRLLPVTFTLRVMPFGRFREAGRGRSVQRVIPYFGFGGGALLWKYREEGEFVDETFLVIVHDRFQSRGIAFEYHGTAGVEIAVNRNLSVYLEGILSRAEDDLSSDFDRKAELARVDRFDDIDLSTDSLNLGLRLRF